MQAVFALAHKAVEAINKCTKAVELSRLIASLQQNPIVRDMIIPIKFIHPDAYMKNKLFHESIVAPNALMIPLMGEGDQEAIRVELREGKWQLSRICDQRVTATILHAIHKNKVEEKSCFLLDVPERNRMFVGYYEGESLQLIPLLQPNRTITLAQLLIEPINSGWKMNE